MVFFLGMVLALEQECDDCSLLRILSVSWIEMIFWAPGEIVTVNYSTTEPVDLRIGTEDCCILDDIVLKYVDECLVGLHRSVDGVKTQYDWISLQPGDYVIKFKNTSSRLHGSKWFYELKPYEFTGQHIPCYTYPDFKISEIKPIQVIYECDINNDDKIDLVSGKNTVVLAYVMLGNIEMMDDEDVVEVGLTYGGIDITLTKTLGQLKQDNHLEFYFTPTGVGDQDIVVMVDPDNKIQEINEENNQNIKGTTLKDTNNLHLAYFPVNRPKTYFGYGPINLTEYSNTINRSGKFIGATYPVAEGEFTNQKRDDKFYGNPVPFLGMIDDAINLWLWGELLTGTSADRVVGIVPDDYFSYHLVGEDNRGVAYAAVPGVLVEVADWTVAAHEIGHTYGLHIRWPIGSGEEYRTNPPGNPANGFWVNEYRKISNGICFMGYSGPKQSFEFYDGRPIWVGDNDYIDLFKKFRINEIDPDVLLVNGYIFSDGTIQLGKSYLVEQGSIDYIIPGDYSIQILDADEQVLANIPFYTSFDIYIDPLGVIETDVAGFAFAIPYPENTSKIRIQHNGETLIEIEPNTQLLHDAVDSIPDYGFVVRSAERRNALHNKINAVEKMIRKNNIWSATRKLEHDLKDKLEKWLVESYQKENPGQLSKDEVIRLVDEIIQRFSLLL